MHHASIAVQAAFARLDATAAVMKRIPRTPSAMPGTSRLAGSGSRVSSRARDLFGDVAVDLRERLQIAFRMSGGDAARMGRNRARA